MTAAPDTTPPVESRTTPEMEEAANASMNAAINFALQDVLVLPTVYLVRL